MCYDLCVFLCCLVSHFFDVTEYVVPEDSASLSVTIRRRGYLGRESTVAIVPGNGSEEMRAHGNIYT